MKNNLLLYILNKFTGIIGLKNRSNSLRLEVEDYIKSRHKDLYEPKYKRIIHYAIDRKRWWLISILVIFHFFVSPMINIETLNIINIKPETAKLIVDQRTANFAAIISMTLVIVGFLINSLAVKEPNAYKVLFKYSYFYPIIYFTLSTISCFIILSTIRDNFTSSSYDYFSRSVISGTYAAIFILILIGILFNRIIVFTNTKEIKNIYHKDLIAESKQVIKNSLIVDISKQRYEEFMRLNGISKFNMFENLSFSTTYRNDKINQLDNEDLNDVLPEQKEIYDINLNKLLKFINKVKKKGSISSLRYISINIGAFFGESQNCLLSIGEDSPDLVKEKLLNKSIIFKKKQRKDESALNSREYFDSKLEELVNENKYKDVESTLESYLQIYQLKNIYNL